LVLSILIIIYKLFGSNINLISLSEILELLSFQFLCGWQSWEHRNFCLCEKQR